MNAITHITLFYVLSLCLSLPSFCNPKHYAHIHLKCWVNHIRVHSAEYWSYLCHFKWTLDTTYTLHTTNMSIFIFRSFLRSFTLFSLFGIFFLLSLCCTVLVCVYIYVDYRFLLTVSISYVNNISFIFLRLFHTVRLSLRRRKNTISRPRDSIWLLKNRIWPDFLEITFLCNQDPSNSFVKVLNDLKYTNRSRKRKRNKNEKEKPDRFYSIFAVYPLFVLAYLTTSNVDNIERRLVS